MKYKTKIDVGLIAIIAISFGLASFSVVIEENYIALGALVLIAFALIALFQSTYYGIEDRNLIIRAGFLINKKIPIENITHIKETRNPISAAALSLDRLQIKHSKGKTLVSPKLKKEFIAALLAINPKIVVVYK